jgi:hypothetical protein
MGTLHHRDRRANVPAGVGHSCRGAVPGPRSPHVPGGETEAGKAGYAVLACSRFLTALSLRRASSAFTASRAAHASGL